MQLAEVPVTDNKAPKPKKTETIDKFNLEQIGANNFKRIFLNVTEFDEPWISLVRRGHSTKNVERKREKKRENERKREKKREKDVDLYIERSKNHAVRHRR